jgi:hypothetical protein
MKKLLALLAGAVVLGAAAGQARAAASPEQRIAALERRVDILAAGPQTTAVAPADRRIAALEKRVKTLEKDLKKARESVFTLALVSLAELAYSECLTAVTADAVSGTWSVIDQLAQATQAGKVYFGPQPVVSDYNACKLAQYTRAPAVPPTLAPFSALTALIGDTGA